MEDVSKIIATINPRYYGASNEKELAEFKKLIKTDGFDAAVKKAKAGPLEEHNLMYDSPTEGLEPVYFWILDFMGGSKVEKIVDNFVSTPGSGHFSELSGKRTQMQAEISKILGNVNIVIKSILNIIYDLKEFEIRLAEYDATKSSDSSKSEAGMLTLKQIWMDQVDVKKGAGSINGLSQQLNFVTLRDAFMAVDSLKKIDKKVEDGGLDLNDRVKRILKARYMEFLEWKDRSEKELRKRFEIEKTYLKSQVASLKMYSRWLKPYIKAASQLEMKESNNPALVNAFSTIVLELTLLKKDKIDFEQAVIDGDLPEGFESKKLSRDYYSVVLVDFNHRGMPNRVSQQGHYSFGGRTEVSFKAYALNQDEYNLLKKKLEEQDINDALKIGAGVAEESLEQLKDDIDYYLGNEEREEKKKEEKKKNDLNPFSALFNIFKRDKDKESKDGDKIKKDSYIEEVVRKLAEKQAIGTCFDIFDIYKKGHQMPSPPPQFYGDH